MRMLDRNYLIASLKGRIWGGEIHKGGYIHVLQEEAEVILELLKEQEPIKPRKILPCITRPVGGYVCGHCGIRFLEKNDYYCPNCGRTVKWNA